MIGLPAYIILAVIGATCIGACCGVIIGRAICAGAELAVKLWDGTSGGRIERGS